MDFKQKLSKGMGVLGIAIGILLLVKGMMIAFSTSNIDKMIPAVQLADAAPVIHTTIRLSVPFKNEVLSVDGVLNKNITIKGTEDKCTATSDDSIYIKAIGIVPYVPMIEASVPVVRIENFYL